MEAYPPVAVAIAFRVIARLLFRSPCSRAGTDCAGLSRSSVDDPVLQDLLKPIFNTIFYLGLEKSDRFTPIETRTIPLFDLAIKLLTILYGNRPPVRPGRR